ncbi:replication initiation protein [Acinetobacter phage vB_AbaS_Silvergun]
MANPWFRLYTEIMDDEKIRLLAFEDRWHYVAILCCKNAGLIDAGDSNAMLMRKLGVKLGLASRELEAALLRLEEVGLIDAYTAQPTAWDDRQFLSDSSTSRVQAYRERKKRTCNVSVTAQYTDTDTYKEEEKKQKTTRAPSAHALLPDVPPELVDDFVKLRKAKRASVTQTAVDGIRREANKAGYTMEQAIRTCCERGWQGFKAEWVAGNNQQNNGSNHAQPKLTPSERIAVNIALDNGGEIPAGYENNRDVVAEVGRNLRSQVDNGVRGQINGLGGSDMGKGIKWVNLSPGG